MDDGISTTQPLEDYNGLRDKKEIAFSSFCTYLVERKTLFEIKATKIE